MARRTKPPRHNATIQPGVHWQVDVIALPPWLTPPDAPDGACVVLVVESGVGRVRMVEIGSLPSMPQPLVSAVTMAADAPMPPTLPGWPEVIEVRDPQVAQWLAKTDSPARVEMRDELPALRAAVDALFERMAPSEPMAWDDAIEPALLALAARVAEVAPWRRYDNDTVLLLAPEGVALPFPVASILGADGGIFGVTFYRSLEERDAVIARFEQEGEIAPFESQVLWFFDAGELAPSERSAFATAGYPRLDVYPALHTISDGSPRPPNQAERAALQRALESVLSFVEAHPSPPEPGTSHTVTLSRRRGQVTVTVLRVGAPALDVTGLPVAEHLESLYREVAVFDMALERETLLELASSLPASARPSADALEGLPEEVPVLVLRSAKREAVRAVARLGELSPGSLGLALTPGCAHCGTTHDEAVFAVFGEDGVPLAGLFTADAELVSGVEVLSEELDGRLLLVLSAGGVSRMAPGRIRSADVLGLRLVEWRR